MRISIKTTFWKRDIEFYKRRIHYQHMYLFILHSLLVIYFYSQDKDMFMVLSFILAIVMILPILSRMRYENEEYQAGRIRERTQTVKDSPKEI